MAEKIEVSTRKVHYGFCPRCAEPVKLVRMHVMEPGENYWKIIGHFSCPENEKKGTPCKKAKAAFFKRNLLASEKFLPGRRKIVSPEQGDLFRI
jgi:hypothetical protein